MIGGCRRRAAAAAAALVLGATAAHAQTIAIGLPLIEDSVPAAPLITATASAVPLALCPCVTTIEVGTTPQLSVPLLATASREGLNASFLLTSLLPERTRIYVRARVIDQSGTVRAQTTAEGVTRSRVRLIRPTVFNQPVFTRLPTFVWSAASVTVPPGPWIFDLTVINTATQQVAFSATDLADTSYTLTTPLEANTSYRWQVRARMPSGDPADQGMATSAATFVISSPDAPVVTLLHNPFPNPFPHPTSGIACIWIDLTRSTRVRVTVLNLRGHLVRLVFNDVLPAGAHGRSNPIAASGCDTRLSWDGTDNRGRVVSPGVYLVVFEAEGEGIRRTAKLSFVGR